ncbi:hypothetical protein LSAT2_014628 [Lamellibrachia satsuma]|nr:hypothetical protein LSAT2_014628 [Lamellibrachia satsuma]
MFVVVEFMDENEVETVLASWVGDAEQGCSWPPYISKITMAIKHFDPPHPSWTVLLIKRVFCKVESYEKARARCRQAEDTSDVGTTDTDAPVKRRRITPKHLDSSESETDSEPVTVKNATTLKRPPPIPTAPLLPVLVPAQMQLTAPLPHIRSPLPRIRSPLSSCPVPCLPTDPTGPFEPKAHACCKQYFNFSNV